MKTSFTQTATIRCFYWLLAIGTALGTTNHLNADIIYQGLEFDPVGASIIDHDTTNDRLVVSNIGSSGQDGVRASVLPESLRRGQKVTLLKKNAGGFDPLGNHGVGDGWSLSTAVDGSDFLLWNAHKFNYSSIAPNQYHVRMDASPVGSNPLTYTIKNAGNIVGEVEVQDNENVLFTGGLPGTVFEGFTDFQVRLDHCDNNCNSSGGGEPLIGITMSFLTNDFSSIEFGDGTLFESFTEVSISKSMDHSFATFDDLSMSMFSNNDFVINGAGYSTAIPEPSADCDVGDSGAVA